MASFLSGSIAGSIVALVVVNPMAAAAAEPGDGGGQDYFAEFPVVLSASRLMQPVQEAPAAVTVIDREMIRASGARQVAELFRLVPGFLVTYRNGHSPTVTYHGLADTYARRLQVMIDGISIYSPLYGGVEWYDLPIGIDDIDRIEIVRGPNGASFGANAFVGMVNIITREPATGDPAEISLNSGSNGINDWSARYAGGVGSLNYGVSLGQRSDRGFDHRPDSSRDQYLNFRGRFRLDGGDELSAAYLHGDGVGTEFYRIERPRHFESDAIQLRWTRAVGANEWWVQVRHAQRREREQYVEPLDLSDIGLGTLPVPLDFHNDQRRDELEFQHSLDGFDQWRLVWGGQLRRDKVRSATLLGQTDWMANSLQRVFASTEWRPVRPLLIHAGATYEHSSLSGSSVSPRISATAFVSDGHSIRFGVSRARRAPTPFEYSANASYAVPPALHSYLVSHFPWLLPPWNTILYQQYRSNGGLSDERILSREIAYLGNWPGLRMSVEVRAFRDQVKDLIYVHRIEYPSLDLAIRRLTDPFAESTTFDFRNMDRATLRGVEGSFRWVPWTGADLMVSAARTVIESSNIDAQYNLSAPNSTASLLFSQRLPRETSVSFAYYRVGAMQWLGGGEPMPTTHRLDIRVAKTLHWGGHNAEVAWVTQNVLNSDDPEFQTVQRNKRQSWLRVHYSY
jgi:iron complex outermembrane recepter protein